MVKLNNRAGFSLVEILIVTSLSLLIAAGALAMMISSVKCFSNSSVESYTDTDAVIAMQRIVNDVREAKSVSILNDGEALMITFPMTGIDGYYDRHIPDTVNVVKYYLSNSSGVVGRSGTWLWRSIGANTKSVVKRDVSSLDFEQDTTRSVKITVTTKNDAASGPRQTELTQRVVYLRNY